VNFVVLSHDYNLAPPAGTSDSVVVKRFWRSSAAPVHCTAGDNTSWEAGYDLDVPSTLVRPAPTKAEVKEGKQKKAEPATRSKAKGSQKRKADDDETEEEEETSPPPAKKMRARTPEPQVGGGAVLGSPRRVEVANVKRARKDFTKTPPRVGSALPHVHFMAAASPDSGSDDDQPLSPARPQPKPPVPLFDDSDDDPAPAPRRKLGSHKRAVPDEDDNARAEETAMVPSPRLTRANAKGRKTAAAPKPVASAAASAAAPKPVASKPAPKTTKPVRQVFDGVELVTPPRKKAKRVPTAPTAAAAPTKRSTPAASEGSTMAADSGESRRRPAPTASAAAAPAEARRQRNPQPPAPIVAAPAVSAPAALANLSPDQVATLFSLLAQVQASGRE
jgi:hypothetical protein